MSARAHGSSRERSLFGSPLVQRTLSLDDAGEARRRVGLAIDRAHGSSDALRETVALAKDAASCAPNDARIAQALVMLRAAEVAATNAARLMADARAEADGSSLQAREDSDAR